MHPSLLWDDIVAATVAVLDEREFGAPYRLSVAVENVPGFGSGKVDLQIVKGGVTTGRVARVRSTFDAHRLVELAAIAVAGLALFAAGGHQIRDVALRGTSADYLVGDQGYLMVVAGRSRRSDLQSAWDARWNRLSDRTESGFFVCVTEFESPSCRLAFRG
jgi:hypothetical protein